MRRLISVSWLCLTVLAVSLPAYWQPLYPGRSSQAAAPAVQFLLDDGSQIVIQVDLEGLLIDQTQTHGQPFQTLDLPEVGWTNEVGRPRLPVIRRFVEVPLGATVVPSVQVLDQVTRKLEHLGLRYEILPVQLPLEKIAGASTPFQKDATTYAADALYPAANVSVSDPLAIRRHQLMMVEFSPVRYNPARGTLEIVRSARLTLQVQGGDAAKSDAECADRFSPSCEDWLSKNVLNYRGWEGLKGTSTQKYAEGILYIVGHAYWGNANLATYTQLRQAEGHKVVTVDSSTIGTTAASIRTYVRNQFLSWTNPALGHVVLVGDIADVPEYQGSAGSGGGQATDNYYAAIDPDNYATDMLAPDLQVSRISVNNATELNTYLLRAIKYWQANFGTTAWMNKLSFMASCDNSSITEGTHNYVFTQHTVGRSYTGTFPTNPTAGGDKLYCSTHSANSTHIGNCLNDGRVIVNFSGHGAETSWGDPSFSNIAAVQHADAAPFVVSNACITGTYDRSGGDCWGEIWLAHSSGAILFWGASNNSYWDEDDILERRMWDGIFFDGITRLDGITHNAKMDLLAHYGAVNNVKYYFEMYNMLGDGSLDCFTKPYYQVHCAHPAEVLLGVDTVNFSVTDAKGAVANALVCLQGSGVQQVGYTDAAGNVSIVMNPAPATVMTLNVTVTAHNGKHYQGTIGVIPASGPYLSYENHEVTSDGSTPTAPNPGKHIFLPVTLRNVGVATAQGITATLSSASAYVTITESSAAYADIAVGATGRSTSHFEFDILPGTPDGTVIPFTINWTTTNGRAAGTTFLSVTVARPILGYLSHTVDDSAAGCDSDGIADANETAVFAVTIRNTGTGAATDVAVTLSAAGCQISGPVDFGDIPAGGQATAEFLVIPGTGLACPAEDVNFTLAAGCPELPVDDGSGFSEVLNADIAGGLFQDDMESGVNGWTHDAGAGTDDWQQKTDYSHSATHSWQGSGLTALKDIRLYTPAMGIGATSTMRFWHRYELENGWDGGVLEISTNGGGTWADLGAVMTQNGYDRALNSSSNPIGGRQAWSGTMTSWEEVVVDLSSFGPNTIQVRFRIGTDSSLASNGWWIDDVSIDSQAIVCQVQQCESSCDYGDLDASGGCDSTDCMLLCAYLAGSIGDFTCGANYADVFTNGLIDAQDLAVMLNHLSGNIPAIPIP